MRKPSAKPKVHETHQQITMAALINLDFAEGDLIWTATANGANLQKKQITRGKHKGKWYSPEGHKLKKMGLLAGLTDTLLWWPIPVEEDDVKRLWMDSGFIEIKTPIGELSDDQIILRQRVKAMGGKYAVARSYEEWRDAAVMFGVKCQYRVNL